MFKLIDFAVGFVGSRSNGAIGVATLCVISLLISSVRSASKCNSCVSCNGNVSDTTTALIVSTLGRMDTIIDNPNSYTGVSTYEQLQLAFGITAGTDCYEDDLEEVAVNSETKCLSMVVINDDDSNPFACTFITKIESLAKTADESNMTDEAYTTELNEITEDDIAEALENSDADYSVDVTLCDSNTCNPLPIEAEATVSFVIAGPLDDVKDFVADLMKTMLEGPTVREVTATVDGEAITAATRRARRSNTERTTVFIMVASPGAFEDTTDVAAFVNEVVADTTTPTGVQPATVSSSDISGFTAGGVPEAESTGGQKETVSIMTLMAVPLIAYFSFWRE